MKTILIVSCCCLLAAAWPQEYRRPTRAQVPLYQQQTQLLQQQRQQLKNQAELNRNNAGDVLSAVPAPDLSQGPGQGRPQAQPSFPRQRPSLDQQRPSNLDQQQPEPIVTQAPRATAQRPYKPSADDQEKPAYLAGSVENVAPAYRPNAPQAVRPEPARQQPNEQYTRGFPEGFTSGLPQFSFQGRMPESDSLSDGGFMNEALANFPSLKNLGGFERMGDIDLKSSSPSGFAPSPAEKPQQGKQPFKDQSETILRRSGWVFWPEEQNQQNRGKGRASKKLGGSSGFVLIRGEQDFDVPQYDDEAFLEVDLPTNETHRSRPKDIADIIEDSKPAEQRFLPKLPFGRPAAPSRRRPLLPPPPSNRQQSRVPFIPSVKVEPYTENNLLGSGNFEVITGGVFRDPGDFSASNYYSNPRPSQQYNTGYDDYYDDFLSNFRDFADINQDRD